MSELTPGQEVTVEGLAYPGVVRWTAVGEGQAADEYVHGLGTNNELVLTLTVPADLVRPVTPPIPPERPLDSVVLDANGWSWQRRGTGWVRIGGSLGIRLGWAQLTKHGPLTPLMPKPEVPEAALRWAKIECLTLAQGSDPAQRLAAARFILDLAGDSDE